MFLPCRSAVHSAIRAAKLGSCLFFGRWMMNLPSPSQQLLSNLLLVAVIISLTAAFERLADEVVMVELMIEQIATVWQTILGWRCEMARQTHLTFELTPESAKAELANPPHSRREFAFQTVLKNRTAPSAGFSLEGAGTLEKWKNGKGILSRWYPQTIGKRISNIELVANRLHCSHGDAFDVLTHCQKDRNTVFFIDPPYTAGGKRAGSRLYTHSKVDHKKLFSLCENLQGDFLMTYDNAEEVQVLAKKHGFQTKAVAMKNTHHAEITHLLFGRDLDWVDEGGMFYRKLKRCNMSSRNRSAIANEQSRQNELRLSSPALRDSPARWVFRRSSRG